MQQNEGQPLFAIRINPQSRSRILIKGKAGSSKLGVAFNTAGRPESSHAQKTREALSVLQERTLDLKDE